MTNQDPEQIARDNIDKQLTDCGWVIQDKKQMNLNAGTGCGCYGIQHARIGHEPIMSCLLRESLSVVIEAKAEDKGFQLIQAETQSKDYADSKLKHLNNEPLPFVFESTGALTRFTDYRDPKPRSRSVFTFHRPETFREWLKQGVSLRRSVFDIPPLNTKGLRDCQIIAINNLEDSFRRNQPKALVQMATGSGKTFTAITAIYDS